MLVTVTRPIEEAVNTVPGLDHLWTITSRGTAEVDLFFNWNVDMYRTLELVNAALARAQSNLPPTAKITANRLTFAAFPIMGYSLTSDKIPAGQALGDGQLRFQAAPQPPGRRLLRRRAGRPGARVPSAARPRQAGAGRRHHSQHSGRHQPQQHDRFARTDRDQSPAGAQPGQRPGPHARQRSPTSSSRPRPPARRCASATSPRSAPR